MKRYGPVALYLLFMAAISGFVYLDGAVWHHSLEKGFILFCVCLMMGLSLLFAGYATWMIWAAGLSERKK